MSECAILTRTEMCLILPKSGVKIYSCLSITHVLHTHDQLVYKIIFCNMIRPDNVTKSFNVLKIICIIYILKSL